MYEIVLVLSLNDNELFNTGDINLAPEFAILLIAEIIPFGVLDSGVDPLSVQAWIIESTPFWKESKLEYTSQ